MEPARIVEILQKGASAGTGYLITQRHVLTARHVLEPARRGIQCEVWPLGAVGDDVVPLEKRKRPKPFKARLDWCPENKDVDLAVVVLEGNGVAGLPAVTVPFGRVRDDGLAIDCIGTGLPEASGRQERRIEARMNWARPHPALDVDVSIGPQDWLTWAGFSGAAMFAGSLLVSVVVVVDEGWGGRVLRTTPVQFLLEDPAFAAYCRGAGFAPPADLNAPRVTVPLLDSISRHLHLIDRRPQTEQILDQIEALPEDQPVPPLIFIISGVDEDEHRLLIKRLATENKIRRILKSEAAEDYLIPQLPWPTAPQVQSATSLRNGLVPELWKLIASPDMADQPVADPAKWRDRFNSDLVPRGFWIMVKRAETSSGHGALLRDWIELWRGIGPGLPVMLFVCIAWDKPERRVRVARSPIPVFLRPKIDFGDPELEPAVQWIISADAANVRAMDLISPDHVTDWIDRIRPLCPRPAPEQLDGVRSLLQHFVGVDGKRLRPIDRQLGALRMMFETRHHDV